MKALSILHLEIITHALILDMSLLTMKVAAELQLKAWIKVSENQKNIQEIIPKAVSLIITIKSISTKMNMTKEIYQFAQFASTVVSLFQS